MKKISKLLLVITFLAISIFIAACSDTSNTNANESPNSNTSEEKGKDKNKTDTQEDITIRWAYQWGEDHFNEHIREKVKNKFPHITFEIQDAGTDHPESLENLVAAKKSPDIVSVGTIEHLVQLEKLGLDYNIGNLIKETGFDLDRIEPALIENAKNQDPHREKCLYALPYERATWPLHF